MATKSGRKWVVREGTTRGEGRYLIYFEDKAPHAPVWVERARAWPYMENWAAERDAAASGGRVVRLRPVPVRPRRAAGVRHVGNVVVWTPGPDVVPEAVTRWRALSKGAREDLLIGLRNEAHDMNADGDDAEVVLAAIGLLEWAAGPTGEEPNYRCKDCGEGMDQSDVSRHQCVAVPRA